MYNRHNRHDWQNNRFGLTCGCLLQLLLLSGLTGLSSSVLAQRPLPQAIIIGSTGAIWPNWINTDLWLASWFGNQVVRLPAAPWLK